MLTLPTDWSSWSPGALVAGLLEQAQARGMYHAVASLLTRASLEQLVESRGWAKLPVPLTVQETRYGFRINDGLFHVLPQFDDEGLRTFRRLARLRLITTVLTPPWSSLVARCCLDQLQPQNELEIRGMDEYVSLRMCFTALDLQISSAEALAQLFAWYNTLARDSASAPNGILIPRRNHRPPCKRAAPGRG